MFWEHKEQEDINKIPFAKDAKMVSKRSAEIIGRREMVDIGDRIRKASNKGEYKIYYPSELSGRLKYILTKRGYKVSGAKVGYVISWED